MRAGWTRSTAMVALASVALMGCSGPGADGAEDQTLDGEVDASDEPDAAAPSSPTDAPGVASPDASASAPPATGDGTAPAGVTVTGAGVASGEPDVVRLTVGVQVERDDAQQALDAANEVTERVIATLDDAGIGADDRQTRDFGIHPRHERDGDVRGYAVRNLVEATIRDVDTVGSVLQAVVDAGGDEVRMHGLRFDLEADAELLASAREAAVEDAREEAEHYAQLAGRELGELVAIEDRTHSSPRAAAPDEALDAAAESGVPIEPGEQDVTVRVVTRWALR